jgi:hypothetical protein
MLKLLAITSAVAAAALATPALAADRVPYRGTDSGTFQVVNSCGGGLLTEDVASGHATHLGAYQLLASECILPLGPGTFAVTGGAFTLTGANGDTISGTYEGTAALAADGVNFTYDVSGPITGGTGRFAGADGELVWHGEGSFATGRLSDVVVGEISSPGAGTQ